MAKLLPSSTSAIIKSQKTAIVKPSKLLGVKSKTSALVRTTKESSSFSTDTLQVIEKKVVQIDKLLKDSLLLSKKEDETKRKNKEKEKFNQKERELENKKLPKLKGINLPSLPKMGFLDWIKNFITQTILGFFAVRLIDFLPQLLKILPVIIKVGDFFIDVGGKMLDGLVTFVDWGYKAIDGTRQFIKDLGGEGLAKNFDKFAGAIDNVIEISILAALATADSGGGGNLFDSGVDFLKRKGTQQAAQTAGRQVATQAAGQAGGTAAQVGGIGVGAAAAIVAGAGLAASALGEGAFQVKKISQKFEKNIKEYSEARKKDKNPITRALKMSVWSMFGPFLRLGNWLLNGIGVTLDIVGAPFRYAIELVRYGIMLVSGDTKGIEQQRKNLAKFDARIRDGIREHFAGFLGPIFGFMGKKDWKKGIETKGSFGNIYGNKGAQKEMMNKMAGGGSPSTRGGKLVGRSSKRTIKKKKKPRTLSFTPRKIKPGASTGGEEKVRQVFPNPEKSWWDPFGVFTGKNQQQQQQQQQKPKGKQSNPQEFLVGSNDVLGRAKYFIGPTATLILKTVMGQKPDDLDYRNIAKGLSAFVQTTFSGGTLGFAGGGEVDAKQYFSGEDYTEVIAKTIKDSASKEVDTTIRNLSKELALRPVGREEMLQKNIERGAEGAMQDATLSQSEMDLFQRLVYAESGGEGKTGMALVARSVLNRAGLIQSGKATTGTFSAKDKTVTGVIMGSGQYTPVSNGRINEQRSQKQMDDAKEAIKLAQDPEKLKSLLKSEGIDDGSIKKLLASTGFRNYNAGARYDASQAVNEVRYKRHTFNTAGNTGLIIASSQISEKIKPVPLSGGDGRFIQGNSGASEGTHFHIGTNKPGDGSGVAAAGFNVIKHFLGKKSIFVGRSKETIPAGATDEQIRGYIARGQRAHATKGRGPTELDLQIGGIGAGNKVAFPLALKGMKYSSTDGYGVSADIVGTNAFVGHGRYKPDGTLAPQQGRTRLSMGAPDFYAFHGKSFGIVPKGGMKLNLHEGEMYKVVDKDSVNLFGFDLTKEIIDIENKSQLIAKAPAIIEKLKSISGYTDYERPEPQVAFIPLPLQDSGGDRRSTSRPSVSYSGSTIDSMGEQISDSLMYG